MVSVCGVVHYNTVAPACRLADAFLWRTCHTVLAGLLGWHQNPLGRCAVVPRRLAAQHAARSTQAGARDALPLVSAAPNQSQGTLTERRGASTGR